ncbi:hypothetical protein BEI59_35250 [Eisenbergiella tayi]|uniref:Uncharacterized protein n=2 Tax=Eisenbergiella tayi TaxID=1432052 RepID=A0A1E3U7D3_9FIRM|nr:hypothetical protein BEI59_35250 [Eisenbergiella tayi]
MKAFGMPRIAVRPAVRMEIKLLAERREAAAQTEMKEQTEAGTRMKQTERTEPETARTQTARKVHGTGRRIRDGSITI